MGFVRRHFWTTALLGAAALPLVGIMIYATSARTRSDADLAVADRCVDWAHESQEAQAAERPDLAARCDRYFRSRSSEEADEDLQRWEHRKAADRLGPDPPP